VAILALFFFWEGLSMATALSFKMAVGYCNIFYPKIKTRKKEYYYIASQIYIKAENAARLGLRSLCISSFESYISLGSALSAKNK
jgi:hypothetical protein